MHRYDVEFTDTYAGEANYSWVKRAVVAVPDLTHYGYTGSTDGSYARANRLQRREIMKQAKAALGLTGVRGVTCEHGDMIEFRPYRSCTVMFVTWKDD